MNLMYGCLDLYVLQLHPWSGAIVWEKKTWLISSVPYIFLFKDLWLHFMWQWLCSIAAEVVAGSAAWLGKGLSCVCVQSREGDARPSFDLTPVQVINILVICLVFVSWSLLIPKLVCPIGVLIVWIEYKSHDTMGVTHAILPAHR